MHTRLFVLFDRKHAETPTEAQQYVYDKLKKEGFAYDDERFGRGRFENGVAEYFSIGGRFTGSLGRLFLDQTTLEKFWTDSEKATQRRSSDDPTACLEVRMLWHEHFPDWVGEPPLDLPTHQYTTISAYEGDAMLVTRELWAKLMTPENWESGIVPTIDEPDYGMIYLGGKPGDKLPDKKAAVGKMWVCVVDFHT